MYGAETTEITHLGTTSDGTDIVAVQQDRIVTAEVEPGVHAVSHKKTTHVVAVNTGQKASQDRSIGNAPSSRALPSPATKYTPSTPEPTVTIVEVPAPVETPDCCSYDGAFGCGSGDEKWYKFKGRGWVWVICYVLVYLLLLLMAVGIILAAIFLTLYAILAFLPVIILVCIVCICCCD